MSDAPTPSAPAVDPGAFLLAHAGDECCDITTIGRRSGKPHRLEIWFGVHDGIAYLISGDPRSDWYANATAIGTVTMHIATVELPMSAAAVTDHAERRLVGDLLCAKYTWEGDESIGLTYPKWCYEVPALRLTPA